MSLNVAFLPLPVLAQLSDEARLRSARLDLLCAIVVLGRHPQVSMPKQVAGYSDLIGGGDSPRRRHCVPRIVRRHPDSEALRRVAREHWSKRRIGQPSTLGADP